MNLVYFKLSGEILKIILMIFGFFNDILSFKFMFVNFNVLEICTYFRVLVNT